ncbi:hypothetical protein CP982_36935 [Streptomyces spectabilis]|uniref:Uncharacterized protein n=1 Tax=Streptomyces spectabilis TaxID=68270 RepID=A0A5P2XKQ2_STRST|nr:hypothetical protein CP982_36935 [Streptomyces spectabilis]
MAAASDCDGPPLTASALVAADRAGHAARRPTHRWIRARQGVRRRCLRDVPSGTGLRAQAGQHWPTGRPGTQPPTHDVGRELRMITHARRARPRHVRAPRMGRSYALHGSRYLPYAAYEADESAGEVSTAAIHRPLAPSPRVGSASSKPGWGRIADNPRFQPPSSCQVRGTPATPLPRRTRVGTR